MRHGPGHRRLPTRPGCDRHLHAGHGQPHRAHDRRRVAGRHLQRQPVRDPRGRGGHAQPGQFIDRRRRRRSPQRLSRRSGPPGRHGLDHTRGGGARQSVERQDRRLPEERRHGRRRRLERQHRGDDGHGYRADHVDSPERDPGLKRRDGNNLRVHDQRQ